MSDYEHSRHGGTYPRAPLPSGGGSGFFWPMVALAALVLLILVMVLGSGPAAVEHPGGAGADPIVVPADPDALPTATGSGTE